MSISQQVERMEKNYHQLFLRLQTVYSVMSNEKLPADARLVTGNEQIAELLSEFDPFVERGE